MAKVLIPQTERFWNAVDKSGDCWLWTKGTLNTGYGAFRVTSPERRMIGAHKFSYELVHGQVPKGLVVDHICHEPRCVRPDHLRAVTVKQNLEHKLTESRTARSGVRGVVWNGTLGKWMAQVRHNTKLYIGGYFDNVEDAAVAVRELRLKLHTHNTFDRMAS